MKKTKILIPAVTALAVLGFLTFAYQHHQSHCPQCWKFNAFSPAVLKHIISGFGPWSFGVFVLLYLLNTISIIPPIGIMSLTAGFLFGPFWGTLALMLGSFLGTSATFFLSRHFGGSLVQRIATGKKAREFQEMLNNNGFKVVLFIRLVPVLPWEIVNYVSGLSRIRYRDYITGTLLGIFPAVVVQTFFSDRLAGFNFRDPALLAAVGAFILLGAVPAVYLKWQKGKRADRQIFSLHADPLSSDQKE